MSSSPALPRETRTPPLPDEAAVRRAAERLAGQAVTTPLLRSAALDARAGCRVLVKAEPLQRTGSFKFRGAYNALVQAASAKRGGVVAYSSGNHAQGVAAAAQILGVPAVIVMPADAPAIKIANTRSYGAEILLYDRNKDSREEIAETVAAERGAVIVRPYDDPNVIAGQGTTGLEMATQAAALGSRLDAVLVPCGGGGLVAGCALALAAASPGTAVWSVEPEGFDDTRRSLAEGSRVANTPAARSFCDALLAPTPGVMTFALNRQLLAGGLAVSDAEVAAAMTAAFDTLKLVVEPGGAVALAAVLARKLPVADKTVGVVLSGGNVDRELFAETLNRAA